MNEKKPSSDQIRKATVNEYLVAQSHSNGNGIRGFFKSNLFGGLVLLAIGWAGTIIAMYNRVSSMDEWRGKTEAKIERMDAQGTMYSHYQLDELRKDVARDEALMEKLDKRTERVPVIDEAQRRLTDNIEQLKNGKK